MGICSGTSTEWLFVHWVWKISLCLSHERVTGVRRILAKQHLRLTENDFVENFIWYLHELVSHGVEEVEHMCVHQLQDEVPGIDLCKAICTKPMLHFD